MTRPPLRSLHLCVVLACLPVLAQVEEPGHPAPNHDPHDTAGSIERPASAVAGGGRTHVPWTLAGLLMCGAVAGLPLLARRGRRTQLGVSFGLALAAAGALLLAGPSRVPPTPSAYGDHDEPASGAIEVDPGTLELAGIVTELVVVGAVAEPRLRTTGRIVPVESRVTHLNPRIAGRVTAVGVRVGDRVRAGQVVARIDSVETAQAAAAYREALAELDLARRTLAARRSLVAAGTYTAAPLEDARQRAAEAKLELATLQSALGQAENEADAARAELIRVERLAASGAYTQTPAEQARGALAEAEAALAGAKDTVAAAEAEERAAAGEVEVQRAQVASARATLERIERLAATEDLDRAPLEASRNSLAEAEARAAQAEAALAQADREAQRGESLYEATLISLNDLEARRTAVRERQAALAEAREALANARSATARQTRIYEARLNSDQALTEARNALAQAETALRAAEARQAKLAARTATARAALVPLEQRVAAARATAERERVAAGENLRAETELTAARLRVQQAERTVAGAREEVHQATRKVEVALAALAREERLFQSGARSREQLLEAERAERQAAIRAENYLAILRLLGASARQAASSAGRIEIPIVAPAPGLVTEVHLSLGETVGPETELLTIADLSEVYAEADVHEPDLPLIAEGQPVRVSVRSQPERHYRGTVTALPGSLDPQTRTARVRALLANPGERLRPETFVTVEFEAARAERAALSVPAGAVQTVDNQPVVFVELARGRYEPRPVRLGSSAGERVAVLAGLEAGERVVTTGSYLLKSQQLKGLMADGCVD